jgi:hypothetical protein
MSVSANLSFRFIYQEDLATSATPNTVNDTVMGVGTVALTPFCSAASDAAAAAAGVNLGEIYMNTSTNRLKARLT